jgi:hypothetical protein
MHPFPPMSELQFLIGKEVSEIAFGAYCVQIRWSDGGHISVEGGMEHIDDDGRTHIYDCVAYSGPPLALHRLLMKKTIMLDVLPLWLTLIFEDGQKLRLKSEEGPYECGLIQFTDSLGEGYIVY